MPERNSSPYPYAQPKTYEFLKAAIAEGAHLKVPARRHFRPEADLANDWLKIRNIAGIYFTSPAVLEDIGKMYGYKAEREGPRLVVNKFIRILRDNSSDTLKEQYPISELQTRKPWTKRSKFKGSLSGGGRLELIDKLFDEGKSSLEIAGLLDLSAKKVNASAKILGRVEVGVSAQAKNKKLLKSLSNLPKGLVEKQDLIDQVKRSLYMRHSEHFISMRSFLSELGVRYVRNYSDQLISQVREAGLAVGVVEWSLKSRKAREIILFKEDVKKHFEEIKEKFNLDPSETQDPTL
jgi:hypothetical protein